MVDVVNRAGIDASTRRVLAVERAFGSAGDSVLGGIPMSAAGEWIVSTVAPAATDAFVRGVAFAATGPMRVAESAVLPNPTFFNAGLPVNAAGQLLVDAASAIHHWVAGWPVTLAGLVAVTGITPPPPGGVMITEITEEPMITEITLDHMIEE